MSPAARLCPQLSEANVTLAPASPRSLRSTVYRDVPSITWRCSPSTVLVTPFPSSLRSAAVVPVPTSLTLSVPVPLVLSTSRIPSPVSLIRASTLSRSRRIDPIDHVANGLRFVPRAYSGRRRSHGRCCR